MRRCDVNRATRYPQKSGHHEVFASLLSLLAAVLGMHFQAIGRTPFDTHPGTMWTFIVAVIIYCCALSFAAVCATFAFGCLAAVSLLSPLLPVLVGRFFFVLWGLIVFVSIGFQHRTLLIPLACQIWSWINSTRGGRRPKRQVLPLYHCNRRHATPTTT